MSSIARWSYKSKATIWPVIDNDDWGQPVYGPAYTVACSWEYGGERQTDSNGNEFTPKSTFYFEAPDGDPSIPSIDDYILRGDHTGEPTPLALAEPIRRVGGWDMTMFGSTEIPDWQINT